MAFNTVRSPSKAISQMWVKTSFEFILVHQTQQNAVREYKKLNLNLAELSYTQQISLIHKFSENLIRLLFWSLSEIKAKACKGYLIHLWQLIATMTGKILEWEILISKDLYKNETSRLALNENKTLEMKRAFLYMHTHVQSKWIMLHMKSLFNVVHQFSFKTTN